MRTQTRDTGTSNYGCRNRLVAPPWVTFKGTESTCLENLQPGRSYELHVTHYGATIGQRHAHRGHHVPAPTSALTCFEYLVGAVICT